MAKEVDTKGYIKLYRKAMEDPIFKDSKAWHLFTYCLFNAKFSGSKGEIGTFTTTVPKDGNYINYSTKNNNTKIYVTKYSNYQFIFDEDIS